MYIQLSFFKMLCRINKGLLRPCLIHEEKQKPIDPFHMPGTFKEAFLCAAPRTATETKPQKPPKPRTPGIKDSVEPKIKKAC